MEYTLFEVYHGNVLIEQWKNQQYGEFRNPVKVRKSIAKSKKLKTGKGQKKREQTLTDQFASLKFDEI